MTFWKNSSELVTSDNSQVVTSADVTVETVLGCPQHLFSGIPYLMSITQTQAFLTDFCPEFCIAGLQLLT